MINEWSLLLALTNLTSRYQEKKAAQIFINFPFAYKVKDHIANSI